MKKIILIVSVSISLLISCHKDAVNSIAPVKNKPPVVQAGPDQAITLPIDSVVLDGSSSKDPDGSIVEWKWKKILGPSSYNIVSANSEKTTVKNLTEGVYKFVLTVKDNGGLTSRDTIQITVTKSTPANHPPVAYAGRDTTITLTSCSTGVVVTLDGRGSSDSDGIIVSYAWSDLDNPHFDISNEATFSILREYYREYISTHAFELMVTDDKGFIAKDTVYISVIQPISPTEYNLDFNLNDTIQFLNNHYIDPGYYDDPYYSDVSEMNGNVSLSPIGNFNFGLNEHDDTAATSYSNASLKLSKNDTSNWFRGILNISFKKLIQNGGGTFTGAFKVNYGSAEGCSLDIFDDEFNNPVILNVTGTLTIISTENNGNTIKCLLSMNVKGKMYF